MPEELVSLDTALTILVGAVIAVAYVRYMWGALERTVRTRDNADSGTDRYRFGLVGALVAVVGSVGAIASYGAGAAFLYVGPLLALSSAVAVAYCLRTETMDDPT
jgi:hypothetical protein